MDKQFLRIVMLSALLPAGVALAKAIEHDRAPLAAMEQNFVSRLTYTPLQDSALEQISEGRRFAEAVSSEQNAANRRDGR
jgi:hypothetical protein